MTQSHRDAFGKGSTSRKPTDVAIDYLRSHDADEIAKDVREKANQVVDDVQEQAAQLNAQATDQVQSAMSSAGQQLNNMAQTIRAQAPDTQVRHVAERTAGALERSGEYLETTKLETARRDLGAFIRKHPLGSALVGLGVGFLLVRSVRR